MATPTRARASNRSRSASSASRTKPRKTTSPKKSSTSGRRRSSQRERSLTESLANAIRRQPRALWGYIVIVLGALTALGIYLDMAGPAGNRVSSFAASALGGLRYLVPIALCLLGIELIREKGHPLRTLAAVVLGVTALSVFAHLVAAGSGGWTGRVIGQPLRGVIGAWGAGLLALFALVGSAWLLVGEEGIATLRARLKERPQSEVDSPTDPRRLTKSPTGDAGATPDAPTSDAAVPPASVFDFESVQIAGVAEEARPAGRKRRNVATETGEPPEPVEEAGGQLAMAVPPAAEGAKNWNLPDPGLLKPGNAEKLDSRALEQTGAVLEETLRQFDVDASLAGITPGPTVTRFEVELAPGVKVAKVKGLGDDIAYALAAERVRIQAPIPGKSAIGVEIPNRKRQLVTLGDILASRTASAAGHPLECGLGKDIAGRPVMLNLAQMPHLLIAGTTGGGKSSTINSLVTTLIMRNGPDRVRLILVDPKRVELGAYDGVPHLLTRVVTNPKRASEALAWTVREMERRYDVLAEAGARDIVSYNQSVASGELKGEGGEPLEQIGYIVVVVDELNDLMMVAARDVEDSIMRIAQMARAVGIHLVIATQRPSTNVITGVIKANIPSRIAFKVGSQVDSRVILDTGGAERLVGMGDMLLLAASSSTARRIQGCYVSEDEVHKVVAHWKRQAEPTYMDAEIFTAEAAGGGGAANGDETDDLLDQALELIVRSQLGSTSMLQRKLRVGFSRAGRLMDLLERKGVVGPSEGSKARSVLMSVEELEQSRNGGNDA